MKIYNAFGITPTNTYVSAGTDYYIPNIKDDTRAATFALEAFKKSYNITEDDLEFIYRSFKEYDDIYKTGQVVNAVHFFLSVGNKRLDELKTIDLYHSIHYFYSEYIVWDNDNKIGVRLKLNDTLFINSGIKIALDTVLSDNEIYPFQADVIKGLRMLGIGVAGLYVNKSGKGNAGFDVRACLVDEDYAGYVHLSMAYTKDLFEEGKNIVYAGDKLTQMMLLPVFHTPYEEIYESQYNELMNESNRGDSGFGSSDIKH